MAGKITLSDAEREARRQRMQQLNASGRRGKRRAKTEDEIVRTSLLKVLTTGTPRQRLDAARQLAELDQRSPPIRSL